MPMKWKRGSNPYTDNAFSVLQVGALADSKRVSAVAGRERGRHGPRDGAEPDARTSAALHAISDAEACLFAPARRAEEQLLVHPQAHADGDKRRRLGQELLQAARLVDSGQAVALRSAQAIFWFTPLPAVDAAEAPPWHTLGLCAPGDALDLELDIVFDG